MVYYGKLSKGCERCRFKKVRCDQRRPGCKRCEKSGTTCPGYRDLGQVMFRDESVRTIEKARRGTHVERFDVVQAERSQPQQSLAESRMMANTAPSLEPPLSRSLQRPLGQMAADFFFNNFVVEGPILSDNNADFLVGIYRDHSDSAAFHAIEAVGLAGLSNVSRDHQLRFESQKRYGQALARTNELLSDPLEATSDLTTMSVLLLGQYENMTVESWDQYNRLAVHVEGASALLKLRGEEQFERESGVRLYFAIRSQILTHCMQSELPVPDSLLEAGKALQNSPIKRPRSSRGSMGDVYLQYINVIAAMRAALPLGTMDMQWLLKEVDDLENTLQAWRLGVYPDYDYTTVQVAETTPGDAYDLPSANVPNGRRHVYKVKWSAHIWNKWRIMCIMLNKLKLDYGIADNTHKRETTIREASMDICLSVPSLMASSRAPTLIWPLYIVSQEVLNDHCIRSWAIKQLRCINDRMGIRQAVLLADLAQADLGKHRHSETLSLILRG